MLVLLIVLGLLLYAELRLMATRDYQSALNQTAAMQFCGREPIREYVQKATAVVKATVFAVTEKNDRANVTLTIENVYAGTVSEPTITIPATIAGAEQQSSDLHFASGQPPYLLFLRKTAGGEWRTSRCYGSRMLKGKLTEEKRGAFQQ